MLPDLAAPYLRIRNCTLHLTAEAALAGFALALSTMAATAGCNSGNAGPNDLLNSANCQAGAAGAFATAVGNAARAGGFGTAFGEDARAHGLRSTAVGASSGGAAPSAEGATSIGANVGVVGVGYYSVAIGAGDNDTHAARALGNFSVGIGNRSAATGQGYATAVGYNARADVGLGPAAVGTDATARGTGAAAFGRFGFAAAEGSTALGAGAWAKRKNSVAIGAGSIAETGNTVSVGTPQARRRIVNVAKAVDPFDAVNLVQVQQLIAASADSAKLGSLRSAPQMEARARHRLASIGDVSITPRSPRLAAANASVSCEFAAGKVVTAADEQATGSTTFIAISQSAISFTQGGSEEGCVTFSFSAEVLAPAGSIMEVRAVMDGSVEASPGPVFFSQEDDAFRSRAFTFLFPKVLPGAHRVELEFRNAGEDGFVRVGQRTAMAQFAK